MAKTKKKKAILKASRIKAISVGSIKAKKALYGETHWSPPMYDTPEKLEKAIGEYFKNCPDKRLIVYKTRDGISTKEVPYVTICKLCYYLGFESRNSFYEYEKKDGYKYIVRRARLFIEGEYEQRLADNPTGAIFALKNMGWRDESFVAGSVEHTLYYNEVERKAQRVIELSGSDVIIGSKEAVESESGKFSLYPAQQR